MYSNKMIFVNSIIMTCALLTPIEAHNNIVAVEEEKKSGDLLPASPINKGDHVYGQLPYLRKRRNSPSGFFVKVEETVRSDDLLSGSPINKGDHLYVQPQYYGRRSRGDSLRVNKHNRLYMGSRTFFDVLSIKKPIIYYPVIENPAIPIKN